MHDPTIQKAQNRSWVLGNDNLTRLNSDID